MKAAPVKTDCESLGNEFLNGVFFSAHIRLYRGVIGIMEKKMETTIFIHQSSFPSKLWGLAASKVL